MVKRRPALLAAVVLFGACGSSDDEADSTALATTPTPSEPPIASVVDNSPDTSPDMVGPADVRAVLDEIIGWMADPAEIAESRFSSEFLAQIPLDQITTVFRSLGVGTWGATDVVEVGEAGLVATLTGPTPALVIQFVLDDTGAIESLLFEPAELSDPPTTLAGLTERLEASAEIAGYLVADVAADSTCQPVTSLAADRPIPLGSVFKLYVLGAVTTAIESGAIAWDRAVTIRDELDSLPSGTTQDEPAGSTVPVDELARRMIADSDNTATDHLIDLVGRDAVEAALAELGHADPGVTLPFPTTRELFVIKADVDLLFRYEAADEADRRALLAGEVAAAALPDLSQFWTEPRAVDTVEWFASPADICRALVELSDRAARPGLEKIAEILSAEPGTEVDPALFTSVLFKGGSEPGVLVGAWLATRSDGTRLVVVGGAADTAAPIDPTLLQLLALGLTLS